MSMDVKKFIKQSAKPITIILMLFLVDLVFAADAGGSGGATGIGALAQNVTKSYEGIGNLMIGTAYVAGIGFGVAAIFKFKQHKDNPTQIPIGAPFTLLAVSAALIFLPAMYKPLGETIFGKAADSKKDAGGFEGGGVAGLPGGGGSQ